MAAFKKIKSYYVGNGYIGFVLFQWAEHGSIDSHKYKKDFSTTINAYQ